MNVDNVEDFSSIPIFYFARYVAIRYRSLMTRKGCCWRLRILAYYDYDGLPLMFCLNGFGEYCSCMILRLYGSFYVEFS